MRNPERVRVTGPLATYADGFAVELGRLGYTPGSACRVMNLMAHASRWLAGHGLGAADLGPAEIEQSCLARRDEGYVSHLSPRAMSALVDYLGRLGVVAAGSPPPRTVLDELLERYSAYLVAERGVAPATVRSYLGVARQFLVQRLSGSGLALGRLDTADVVGFVLAECPRLAPASAASPTKGLRSLLRFLHVEGLTPVGLAGAVPGAAGWRLAPLPSVVEPATVVRLLASCDGQSAVGLRDLAVLTVLARLGLRAGEVAAMELADIDWRSGELMVRGKGNRQDRLPLPVDVGEAVVGWLRCRPHEAGTRVFTTSRAPIGPLSSGGVSAIVRRACRRCGTAPIGSHRLRHTTATDLLRAGAGLREVGLVLRHHRLSTTAIYAKVDHLGLSSVAMSWPGGAA